MRKIKSIFWYTHKGPTDFLKKIFLLKASIYSNKIITASKNSFPYKRFFNNKRKLHVIGHAIKFDEFFRKINSFDGKDFVIISRISKSKKIDESISGFLNSDKGSSHKLSVIGGPLSSEDEIYFENLKLKYASHKNISFFGSMPHKNLINEISDFSFHINNTEEGFYDKSVLETMSHGLINFYSNSDYDELLPEEYRNKFKFDGTPENLSKKITDVENLKLVCKCFQLASPVGSYLSPCPAAMPGYESDLIMAGGTFIDGSTSEFSADAPLRPPYNLYVQGGTHRAHIKIAVSEAVIALLQAGLVELP